MADLSPARTRRPSHSLNSLVQALRFFWGFVRHPRAVGSIVPSSPYLAAAVAAPVPASAQCVVELGPGTGPITRALLARLGPSAAVVAVEIDPDFCALLRREVRDRRLHVVRARAPELPLRPAAGHRCAPAPSPPAAALARAGEAAGSPAAGSRPIEAIVSGLPFANFSPALRAAIVEAAFGLLAPGGVFSGYGYAPFALPSVLRRVFGRCTLRLVWRNVPPAFVAVARKT
jgi:phosphatidylethanolamine/phosphatidyl-N-methylethanolamine N-methyltransferase